MARRNKTENTETDYDKLYSDIRARRVPLLSIDNDWHNLFIDGKPRSIEKLERELIDAVKSRSRVSSEREELNQLKHTLMKKIIDNMDAEEESRASKKLEKSKALIEDINDKLILIEDRELSIPDEIRNANTELLIASMDMFLSQTAENREQIEDLEGDIEQARIELKRMIAQREELIEQNERVYKFFDKAVGKGIVSRYERYLRGE